MKYRIWTEEEKEMYLAQNNKDIIKYSVETAIAVAVSLVSLKIVNTLPTLDMAQRIAVALGELGIIGLDIHAGMNLFTHLYDRDNIKEYYYTYLYGPGNKHGRRQ